MTRSATLSSRIRQLIALGELPNRHANRLLIGCGEGHVCDGCGEVIDERSLEYQFDAALMDAIRRLRLHDECFELWELETGEN